MAGKVKEPNKVQRVFLTKAFRIAFIIILCLLIVFVILPGYIIAISTLVFNYNMSYLRALLLSTAVELSFGIAWFLNDDATNRRPK